MFIHSNNRMKMKALALIAATTLASTGYAQTNLSEAKLDSLEKVWSKTLDEVVVTGTRTPKLLSESPILTRVITASDIRKSDATNISDLLQAELPGIEFSYSMNQQVSLNMQGFGGNSVLFLVDGERLAGETLDNVDYDRLNLNNAGKIEIVKGAASSLYGSNAVGGVVNIISREATEPWTLNINGRYGQHNSQRYGAVFSVNKWKISSSTTAQYSSIDSYDMKNSGDYSRYYGSKSVNVGERLTFKPVDRLKLIGRAGYFFRERYSQVSTNDRYRDFSGGLRGIYDFTPGTNLELSYSFDQYDKSDYVLLTRRDVRDYSNVQNIGKLVFNHTFAGRHIFTLGGDVMRDYLMSYQFDGGGSYRQITADGFAQLDMTFNRLNIIAGGRYDYFSEADMKHMSSRVNIMYRLNRFNIRGSYAGGFRAPTLKEMYMNFDMASIFMIYGNPYLQPEVSNNFQLSGEYTRGLLNANLGTFCNLVDNRITTVWNKALSGMQYTNIGHVTISGIDANVSWRTAFGLGTRLSYIYTYEHVRKGEPYTSSTRPHTATVRFDYSHQWREGYVLSVALNGRVLSDVTVDEFTSLTSYEETERVKYPGYTMWKLNMTHSFWKGIDVILTVDNLFNYVPKYNYSSTPSTTGISFNVGVSLDIDKMFK
ncbi:MAG: TonB-dependent receptor [Bacteroides sp.]|nr:TonB-dependent receptor [Bacteroides sp.]